MNLIGNLITLFPLILVIFLVLFDPMTDKTTKYFSYALFITAIESILEIVTALNTSNTYTAAVISHLANAIGFSLAPLVGFYMLSIGISKTSFEKYRNLLKVPLIVNIALCISSIWLGLVFSVTPDNVYTRGPLFPVQFFISLGYTLFFIIISFSKKKKYIIDDLICFGVNFILILIGISIQILQPKLLLIWSSVSIGLMFYFICTQNMKLRRDALTNVLNRYMYQCSLACFNNRKRITIVNIDINDFKTINDTYGHAFGDKVLKAAAEALQKEFEDFGYTYRLGGDEFCILAKNHLSNETLTEIFLAIEEDLKPLKEHIKFTTLFSYGHYHYDPKTCHDIHESVKVADQYMYQHKKDSKSDVVNF